MFPKPKTPRSSSHLTWLRTLPCAWCGGAPPSESSHHGRRGVGIKASDLLAVPLCRDCHARHHGPRFGAQPPLPLAGFMRRGLYPDGLEDFPVREWAEGYAKGLRFRKAEEKP